MTRTESGPIAVVIVAYHRPDQLARLLSCLDDPGIATKIVNVEADRDVSAAAAGVFDLEGNPGFATAVNAGVREIDVDAQVTVFMNDDVLIDTHSLRRLAEPVLKGEADVAVPRLVDRNGTVEGSILALPTLAALAVEWMLLPDHPPHRVCRRLRVQKWRRPTTTERVAAAAATVVAARTEVLHRFPLPDQYFLYWEELDWFWRLGQARLKTVYVAEASASHAGGRQDVRREKSMLLARNGVRCVRATQGRGHAAIGWFIVGAWNLRLLAQDAIRPSRWNQLPARWAGLVAACAAWKEIA